MTVVIEAVLDDGPRGGVAEPAEFRTGLTGYEQAVWILAPWSWSSGAHAGPMGGDCPSTVAPLTIGEATMDMGEQMDSR